MTDTHRECRWSLVYRVLDERHAEPAIIEVKATNLVSAMKQGQMALAEQLGRVAFKIIRCEEVPRPAAGDPVAVVCETCGASPPVVDCGCDAPCDTELTPDNYIGGPVCIGPERDA